jgi:hypothetical protein
MTWIFTDLSGAGFSADSKTIPQCCKKIALSDPAGTLEKALERNIFNVKHDRPLPLLDLTLGEVLDDPSDSNKTRIPRRWKCSRRVCPIQR